MGPAYEPSPPKGVVKCATTKIGTQYGAHGKWRSSSQLIIHPSACHQAVPSAGIGQLPSAQPQSHAEIDFFHWEQHKNIWHFPGAWLLNFKQAAQWSDSIYMHYNHELCIWTVPVDEGGLYLFTSGG